MTGDGSGNWLISLWRIIFQSFSSSLGGQNLFLTISLIIIFLFFLIFIFRQKKKDDFLELILSFLVLSLFGVSFYTGKIADHYLGSVYPSIFLLAGYFFEKTLSLKKIKNLLLIYGGFLIIFNLAKVDLSRQNGYHMPEGWNMKGVKKTTQIILEDINQGERGKYEVAAILDGDTRAYPYRYFLEVMGEKPMGVEDYPQAKVLYVIGRGNNEKIISYPVWEIYSFLPAEIDKVWNIQNDVKLFKLVKKT